MRRVSVDIGGTFTDCFLAYDGRYVESKALTTHNNLATGFMAALEGACREIGKDIGEVLAHVDAVRYATTLGTNALIQRKGPKVALLTTTGFESTAVLMRARGYGDGLSEAEQGQRRLDGHVGSEGEERDGDDPKGGPLPTLRVGRRELPGDGRRREDFDDRVEAEGDECR